MLPRAIDSTTIEDLQILVDNQVQEGTLFDFKRDFYRIDKKKHPDFDKQRVELLKDISSFANTVGGDLIIGVDENDFRASDVCGFECDDIDGLMNQVNQLVNDWLQPRVPVAMKAVPHSEGRYVLIIRIQQSLISPHRVVYGREFGQFWARNSTGAFAMDTSQLRTSFNLSATIFEQMSHFRDDRTHRTRSKAIYVHLIPQDSFASRISFPPELLKSKMLQPIGTRYRFETVNLDGALIGNTYPVTTSTTLLQQFRNGTLEACDLGNTYVDRGDLERLNTSYFSNLLRRVPSYLNYFLELGLMPPYWFFLTLVNMQHVSLPNWGHTPAEEFDRDHIKIPEIEINSIESIEAHLRPALDMVWNARRFR